MFILGTSTPGKNISCVDSNNSGFTTDSTVSNSITGVSGYNKTRPDIIWFLSCLWGYKLTAIWAPMEKNKKKKLTESCFGDICRWYGYGSDWRMEVIKWCLDFAKCWFHCTSCACSRTVLSDNWYAPDGLSNQTLPPLQYWPKDTPLCYSSYNQCISEWLCCGGGGWALMLSVTGAHGYHYQCHHYQCITVSVVSAWWIN